MIVGTVRELKNAEYRVASRRGRGCLVREGHRVLIEAGAGIGSGFSDDAYRPLGGDRGRRGRRCASPSCS
jgi:alanine dehydrogenase